EVASGVAAGRLVATPDMSALSAPTQVDPPASGLQAFDAAGPARRDGADVIEVGAGNGHVREFRGAVKSAERPSALARRPAEEVVDCTWGRERVSLGAVTAVLLENRHLRERLDAFADDDQPEAVREVDCVL